MSPELGSCSHGRGITSGTASGQRVAQRVAQHAAHRVAQHSEWGAHMTNGYNTRLERRDLVLATITAIFGGAAVVMAAAGVLLLAGVHF